MNKHIESLQELNEAIVDGEVHEFLLVLKGGVHSRKQVQLLPNKKYRVVNCVDSSIQTLTAAQLFQNKYSLIGLAIKYKQFIHTGRV